MIDFDRKILYIHIPKCAGTSIKHSDIFSDNSLEVKNLPEFKKIKDINKRYFEWMRDEYRNYFRVLKNAGVDENFKSFAIFRNPWERVLSYWSMLKKPKQYSPLKKLSFEDFVKNFIRGKIKGRQRDYWHTIPGSILINAYQDVFDSDIGLAFDIADLDTMMPCLCDYLEIPEITLGKRNTTKHGSIDDHYDTFMKEIVREKYQEDIDIFGYSL